MRLSAKFYSPRIVRRSTMSQVKKSALDPKPIRNVDQIIIKPTSQHPAIISASNSTIKTFTQLRLRDEVVNALHHNNITQPTLIQILAIPKILRGKNVLCAAETGSGKTFAYLAPLISRLKEEEDNGLITRLRRPRALVLLHSRDLAKQVLLVTKSLSHTAKFRAVGLIGGIKRRYVKDALEKPVDVAIATPDALLKFKHEERILLSDLSHLVIDEADTLFDESFDETVMNILKSIKIRKTKPPLTSTRAEDTQLTIVGATISNSMLKKLESLVPNLKKVSSKNLHQILPHVEQRFVKVNSHMKSDKLVDILKENSQRPTIVFCNTVPSCDWTARFLESRGIPVIKLHAGLDPVSRQSKLKEFADGRASVFVCTDVASRGIDTSHVSLVILFDWPFGLTDYLHRVGRTGRLGTKEKCIAISFMTRRRDVKMAWTIKNAADQKQVLLNRKVSQKLSQSVNT